MTGYTKLFSSILASTIWSEPKETKVLWITMLAMAGKYGEIHASIPGLAHTARLTVEETESSLQRLMEPDTYSRTKDFEGRRIQEIDGGWQILNHAKYRKLMSAEERKEYLKLKQAESRERRKSTSVNTRQQESTKSTHTEAEADSEEDAKKKVLEAEEKLKGLGHLGLWTEWKKIRKKKGGATTPTAEALILSRLLQHPGLIQKGLEKAITSSWIGFQWDWVDKSIKTTSPKTSRPKPVEATEEVGPMPGFKERMDKAKDRSSESELEEVE